MRHGGFLRTSHEARRRSSTVTLHPPPGPGDGVAPGDPYRRRSSTGDPLQQLLPGERRPSFTDLTPPSPAGSRRGSACLAPPPGPYPSHRRRSNTDRPPPPLVKRFSSVNFELSQSRILVTIFIICSCCVMVAVLSYVFRHYVDIDL